MFGDGNNRWLARGVAFCILAVGLGGCADRENVGGTRTLVASFQCGSLSCNFTAETNVKEPSTFLWDLGDGTEANGSRVLKHYNRTGGYTVRVQTRVDGLPLVRSFPINVTQARVEGAPFPDGGEIPLKYTCAGGPAGDVSPAFMLTNLGNLTSTIAVVMVDPDANGYLHWFVHDVPVGSQGVVAFAEGDVPSGSDVEREYAGPCPLGGKAGRHRYVFTFYLLDKNHDADAAGGDALLTGISRDAFERVTYTGTFAFAPVP